MTWETDAVDALEANDVTMIAYLPDSATSGVIDCVEDREQLRDIRLAREEEGVGILTGGWLGHERGALVCQSSGLATTINALGSLSKPARIPFVALVTRRGELGEFNLAQVPFGYNMPSVLDTMGIRNTSVGDPEEIERTVDMATKSAFSTEEPYVVILEPTLTGAKDEY